MFNVTALKAIPEAQESIKSEDYHQAVLDAGYAAWQLPANKDWDYTEMLDYVEETFGEVAKLLVMVGKYNQQVGNGGHYQYFDNGYAGQEDRRRRNGNQDLSLHEEMVKLFEKHRLQFLINGEKVLTVMKNLRIVKDEERTITETCSECGGNDDDCKDCDNGEVEVDNPEYGCVTNTDELDKLDTAFYAVNDDFMTDLNKYAKNWLDTGKDPISTATPFDPFDLEPSAEVKAATPVITPHKPRVKLVGADGNAFNVMGLARRAMRDAKIAPEVIEEYLKEAQSGDYDHLLATTMKYCDVY
jgi:hypothetical protein